MEELQPQELEKLVQELEEEYDAQEPLPQEVEELLRVLQSGSPYLARQEAAEQLGNVETSSLRIVRALLAAYGSHSYPVSRAAAKSLRAPVHQEYLQQHRDPMEAAERAVEQRPGSDGQLPDSDLSVGTEGKQFGMRTAYHTILNRLYSLFCALGRHSGKWEYVDEDSCRQILVCIRCGHCEEEIRHLHGEWEYVDEDPCRQILVCIRCGHCEEEIRHLHGEWEYREPGSCLQVSTCSRCGFVDERTWHDLPWGESKRIDGDTWGMDCKRCGETYTFKYKPPRVEIGIGG